MSISKTYYIDKPLADVKYNDIRIILKEDWGKGYDICNLEYEIVGDQILVKYKAVYYTAVTSETKPYITVYFTNKPILAL